MGVRLLNFFDLKPLNTSKWSLNPPFFRDTQYILYIEATNRRLAQWGFTDSILLLICSNHTQNTHTLCSRWELQFCNFLPTLVYMYICTTCLLLRQQLAISTCSETWENNPAVNSKYLVARQNVALLLLYSFLIYKRPPFFSC